MAGVAYARLVIGGGRFFAWLNGAKSNKAALAPKGGAGGPNVIGHYPDYKTLAGRIRGSNIFEIPMKGWNKMSIKQQWAVNSQWLEQVIARGEPFRLATPLNQVRAGSWYQREISYFLQRGYTISRDGLWLIP